MKKSALIVGGGIVGCMTAMQMVKRGFSVTIVERNQIASQTSGESSWAGAGILFPLLPWMYSDEVNQLAFAGADLYQDICQELLAETGIDAHLINSGMYILPTFDMHSASKWCLAHGLPHEIINPSANEGKKLNGFAVEDAKLKRFSWTHLTPHDEKALWLPTVSQVRPPYLMLALRAWLEKNKVNLLENTSLKPLQETQSLNAWQTTSGEKLSADVFIVTSGAWSFELLKDTASKLNIKPMRGQILLYKPAQNLAHIVYKDGFYMVPRRDGYLLVGSTLEDVGFDASTTEKVRDELQIKAARIMPSLQDLPIIKHWSGLRPGTPENLPTIGAHPNIQNLYLNTGHFRYGLTMAPSSAKKLLGLI